MNTGAEWRNKLYDHSLDKYFKQGLDGRSRLRRQTKARPQIKVALWYRTDFSWLLNGSEDVLVDLGEWSWESKHNWNPLHPGNPRFWKKRSATLPVAELPE